ncbi:radial spoke head protein 9 homolog [Sycon ciliatum]|uniref:radial spoke head protein 9 homolog n=1 Tax=Sycon ciliatum TaxID=27933 RepID=UPI0020AA6404|eukprot:scpid77995/ scgid32730/ Radial spoke head protein 9 homolog
MDVRQLPVNIGYLNHAGIALSAEERTCLQAGFDACRFKEGFHTLKFWGIIHGINAKYYIVQGLQEDPLKPRITLYSKDYAHWARLPSVTDEMRRKTRHVRGRFTGDPSFDFEYCYRKPNFKANDEDEHGNDVLTERTSLKEEERLAATVELINHEVEVMPRGYLRKSAKDEVKPNPMWQGLSLEEALLRSNYYHANPKRMRKLTAMVPPRNVPAIDFLESIEDAHSKPWWLVRGYRGSTVVTLRSLLWEGYTFFMVPDSRTFGSFYSGYGERNLDVVHMLPCPVAIDAE